MATSTTTTIPVIFPTPPASFHTTDPTTPQPQPTTVIYQDESMKELAVRGILTGLLGIGCGLLAFGIMVAGFFVYRWFRFRRYQAVLDRLGIMVERRRTALQERIDRRYETIEHWLITKKILKHDEFCRRVCCEIVPNSPPLCQVVVTTTTDSDDDKEQPTKEFADDNKKRRQARQEAADLEKGQGSSSQDKSSSSSGQEQEEEEPITYFTPRPDHEWDEEKECPICMNTLCPDDIVSWSANPKCNHVFHHQCVKEWLLRKTGCPFCRETFLPCDSERGRAKKEQLSEMSKKYASRHSTTYYCMKEGLIALPPTVRCTLTELTKLKDRIFDSSCAPKDLVTLRGEREEGTITQLGAKQQHQQGDGNGDDCDPETAVAGMDNIEEPSENPDMGDDLMVCITTPSSSSTETTETSGGNVGRLRREETSSALTAVTDIDDDDEEEEVSDTTTSTSSGPFSDSAEENV